MQAINNFFVNNLLYILLSICFLSCFFILSHFRDRLSISTCKIFIVSLLHTISGVLCVKLFAGIENFGNPFNSGMSLFGSIFFLPIFYFILAKLLNKRAKDIFDIFTLCLISALLIVRFNCIIQGCCRGIFLPNSDTVRFPTREIEIVFHIIIFIYFFIKIKKPHIRGDIYPQYMIFYGGFRFIEEFFRANKVIMLNHIHLSHIWAVVCFVVGLSFYLELHSKNAVSS